MVARYDVPVGCSARTFTELDMHPGRAIFVLVHLQKPISGFPRPEFGGEADDSVSRPGGEGGNRVIADSGPLLALSLAISAAFVALVTAALFY
jgi:hypothetical protein